MAQKKAGAIDKKELDAALSLIGTLSSAGKDILVAIGELDGLNDTIEGMQDTIMALGKERAAAIEARDSVIGEVRDQKAVLGSVEAQVVSMRAERAHLEEQITNNTKRLEVIRDELKKAIEEFKDELKAE
jgi:chromosome segregation ATPase